MDYSKLLISHNNSGNRNKSAHIIKGTATFNYGKDKLDISGIRDMINFVANIRAKYGPSRMRLHFVLGTVVCKDKLTITLLECLMYSLLFDYGYLISIDFQIKHTIFTEAIKHSSLLKIGRASSEELKSFSSLFKYDMSINHFRDILDKDAASDSRLSVLMDNVNYCFEHAGIDHICCDALSKVISEIVGNATEHNKASCLLDIDISNDYDKKGDNGKYVGIGITLVSFSENIFGEDIRTKIIGSHFSEGRYSTVAKAYANHSKHFSSDYTESDFFRIAAFQDRITGRPKDTNSSGKGLTELLRIIEELSDSDNCYLLVQNRILHFYKDLLYHSNDQWVSFNSENDFVNHPPDPRLFESSAIYMPGTAYNLNFVCRKVE